MNVLRIKGHEKIVFELMGDDFREIGRNASEDQKIARLKWTGLGIFASVRVKIERFKSKKRSSCSKMWGLFFRRDK